MVHRSKRRVMQSIIVFGSASLASMLMFAAPSGADPGNGLALAKGHDTAAVAQSNTGQAASHATEGTAATVGDPTSPQPASNADNTGNGANTGPGPYTSTRDGSPSLNGNGNGEATGLPCAGCVGQADNKNPEGQMPNGSDPNAGYECDTNHGIGRTNPAHTGCLITTTTPPETPNPPETPPVIPEIATQPVAVLGVSATRAALAFTGTGHTGDFVLIGIATAVLGLAALALARRRLVRLG